MATANWTALCVAVLVCVTLADVVTSTRQETNTRFPTPTAPRSPTGYPLWGIIRYAVLTTIPVSVSHIDGRTGDLVYSRLFNQDIIIINSEKIAKDLLEDRSSNYSDRPNLVTTATIFKTISVPTTIRSQSADPFSIFNGWCRNIPPIQYSLFTAILLSSTAGQRSPEEDQSWKR
ncbi:hypothetical protein BU15DRAFT_62877 [Melanogaster broomeanus]|nr:hypothetical protein BU15DRAFT_62877 [Melanogaster broomeanus]